MAFQQRHDGRGSATQAFARHDRVKQTIEPVAQRVVVSRLYPPDSDGLQARYIANGVRRGEESLVDGP